MDTQDSVKLKDFGKDHWSLLAYIKTRCVDHRGALDIKHMRTKNEALASARHVFGPQHWKPEYGTRLSGYWNEDGTTNPDRRIDNHDDHDCQEDLERAGYIVNIGTGLNPAVKLTKLGLAVAAEIDAHKAGGGVFATFRPSTSQVN